MDKRSNKAFEFRLDNEKGVLQLTGLLIDTMVYLYDDHGNLQAKEQYTQQPLTVQLPKHGIYVLVLLHPICEIAVRRFCF
ncbi:hypothetical protein [Bacteroides sp.]